MAVPVTLKGLLTPYINQELTLWIDGHNSFNGILSPLDNWPYIILARSMGGSVTIDSAKIVGFQ